MKYSFTQIVLLILITSNELLLSKSNARFTGNVVLEDSEQKAKADSVTVYFTSKKGEVSHIELEGHVTVEKGNNIITCDTLSLKQ